MSQAYLFVYGTLMRRFSNPAALRLRRNAWFAGQGSIIGTLYNLGAYPAVALGENAGTRVHGELYALREPHTPLRFLDRYEGCSRFDPQPHLYKRTLATVSTRNGRTITAWVYVLNRPPQALKIIANGRYPG